MINKKLLMYWNKLFPSYVCRCIYVLLEISSNQFQNLLIARWEWNIDVSNVLGNRNKARQNWHKPNWNFMNSMPLCVNIHFELRIENKRSVYHICDFFYCTEVYLKRSGLCFLICCQNQFSCKIFSTPDVRVYFVCKFRSNLYAAFISPRRFFRFLFFF